MKTLKPIVLSGMFLFSAYALKLGCKIGVYQNTNQNRSEFRSYPIEKLIDSRLNTPYWNLPEFKLYKTDLAKEIINLHSAIADFLEERIDKEAAYKQILVSQEQMSVLMKGAFKRIVPKDFAAVLENENYSPGTDNNKTIYKYRLPTLEEIGNEKLWLKWVQNGNLYESSIWLLGHTVEQAYINAVFEVKELGVPDSTLPFNFYLQGELTRLSELIKKQ